MKMGWRPAAAIAMAFLARAGSADAGWTESVLLSFNGADGSFPWSGVVKDGSGALYGTTNLGGGSTFCGDYITAEGCGAVYKLTPPGPGKTAWKPTPLYSFSGGADGGFPRGADLVIDKSGVLYGTTTQGGDETGNCPVVGGPEVPGCGVVFSLTPPAGGKGPWTETVLYSFTASGDGAFPTAGLTIDPSGALYGVATDYGGSQNGVVFKLTPPAAGQTGWTQTVPYTFGDVLSPTGALIMDGAGALYGAASQGVGAGSVFKLTPPAPGQTAWTPTTLRAFNINEPGSAKYGIEPTGRLLMDGSGALYGAAAYGGGNSAGVIFKLTPPAAGKTAWTETVLHTFTGGKDGAYPNGGLVMDSSGALYGTTGGGGAAGSETSGAGVAFKLTPPAPGKTAWTETVLKSFTANSKSGSAPLGDLIIDKSGALYGTTASGGEFDDNGTVFKLTP
jgi:hypothetical protein